MCTLPLEGIERIAFFIADDAASQALAKQEKWYVEQDKILDKYITSYEASGGHYNPVWYDLKPKLPLYGLRRNIGLAKAYKNYKKEDRKDIHTPLAQNSAVLKSLRALHETCKLLSEFTAPFMKLYWDKIRAIYHNSRVHLTGLYLLKYHLKRRDLAQVRLAQAVGIDINRTVKGGRTLLSRAVRKSNLNRVEDLAMCGAELNRCTYWGILPINIASEKVKKELIRLAQLAYESSSKSLNKQTDDQVANKLTPEQIAEALSKGFPRICITKSNLVRKNVPSNKTAADSSCRENVIRQSPHQPVKAMQLASTMASIDSHVYFVVVACIAVTSWWLYSMYAAEKECEKEEADEFLTEEW